MIIQQSCYQKRFSSTENRQKNQLWKILCDNFLQQYINRNDTVLDIGAGYCEFINNIRCKKKIALDLNPDTKLFANKEVQVFNMKITSIPEKFYKRFNVIFISNFLEHLDSKEEMLKLLQRVNKLLTEDGKLLIIQPNISLVKEKYWNFFDHKIPINGDSLQEALSLAGFKVEEYIEKFLPYTTKSKIKMFNNRLFLKIYLELPQFLRLFAGQSFIVAKNIK